MHSRCVCVCVDVYFIFFLFFFLPWENGNTAVLLQWLRFASVCICVVYWISPPPPSPRLFLFGVCVPFHSIPDITQTQREMRSGSQLRPKDWRTQMGVRRSIVSLPQTVSSCPIPPCPLCMESNAHERLVPLVNGEFCHVPYPTPILFRPFVRALFSLSCFYF
jgi:hypothetical protein